MDKTTDNNQQRSADIGLSDIFLILSLLSPDSEKTKKAIVNALGFEWRATTGAIAENPIIAEPTNPNPEENVSPGSNLTGEKENEEKKDSSLSIETLHPQEETEEIINVFNVDWEGFEDLPETKAKLHFEKPRHVPLINENWFRGIMSLILSTPMPTTKIDLKLVEKNIVRLSPIQQVPYLYRQSLERGVQIILDVSELMQPFWRDEAELVVSLSHLLDAHKVQVFEIEIDTLPRPRIIWQNGSPEHLQPEIPVLIVTNFGAVSERAMRIRNSEPLLKLLEEAKSRKCPVMALIPLPEKNLPADIKKFIPYSFIWDRTTSSQVVSRIKR